ncbi:FkbM family methyltransferase [Opitutales bacterium]|nr:FkbM family methyltransferase [Opitutales bacterium]
MLFSPILRALFSERLIHKVKCLANSEYNKAIQEDLRLQSLPRYTKGHTYFEELKIHFTDIASFRYSQIEIFKDEIYAFPSRSKSPKIIDCGANIGLSTLFFALKYPKAEIISFEADPVTFQTLQLNIYQLKNTDIKLYQKAVWTAESKLLFNPDGADGGNLLQSKLTNPNSIEIDAIDLRSYLQEPIDMLKIDIEGAEKTVIPRCKDLLPNVQNLFIEYHGCYEDHDSLVNILNILNNTGFTYRLSEVSTIKKPYYWLKSNPKSDSIQYNIFATQLRNIIGPD